jgi:hypothetical protein
MQRRAELGLSGRTCNNPDIEPIPTLTDRAALRPGTGATSRLGVELLDGSGGLSAELTKTFLQTAIEAEITDHFCYYQQEPKGRILP